MHLLTVFNSTLLPYISIFIVLLVYLIVQWNSQQLCEIKHNQVFDICVGLCIQLRKKITFYTQIYSLWHGKITINSVHKMQWDTTHLKKINTIWRLEDVNIFVFMSVISPSNHKKIWIEKHIFCFPFKLLAHLVGEGFQLVLNAKKYKIIFSLQVILGK